MRVDRVGRNGRAVSVARSRKIEGALAASKESRVNWA